MKCAFERAAKARTAQDRREWTIAEHKIQEKLIQCCISDWQGVFKSSLMELEESALEQLETAIPERKKELAALPGKTERLARQDALEMLTRSVKQDDERLREALQKIEAAQKEYSELTATDGPTGVLFFDRMDALCKHMKEELQRNE